MTFPTTVWFEETGEERTVERSCLRCQVDADDPWFVVSPAGIAHHGAANGHTDCGIDATGDGWWWPL